MRKAAVFGSQTDSILFTQTVIQPWGERVWLVDALAPKGTNPQLVAEGAIGNLVMGVNSRQESCAGLLCAKNVPG